MTKLDIEKAARESIIENIYKDSLKSLWPQGIGCYERGIISIGFDEGARYAVEQQALELKKAKVEIEMLRKLKQTILKKYDEYHKSHGAKTVFGLRTILEEIEYEIKSAKDKAE